MVTRRARRAATLSLLPSDAWELIVEHFCEEFMSCNFNALRVCGGTAAIHLLDKAWRARYCDFMRHFCAFRTMNKMWNKVFTDQMLAKLKQVKRYVNYMWAVRGIYVYHRKNALMNSYTLCVQLARSRWGTMCTTIQHSVPRLPGEHNQPYLRRIYRELIVGAKRLACYWPTLVYLIDREADWQAGPVYRDSYHMFEWPDFQDNHLRRVLSVQEDDIVVSMRLCEMIKGVRDVYCPWTPALLTSQQT